MAKAPRKQMRLLVNPATRLKQFKPVFESRKKVILPKDFVPWFTVIKDLRRGSLANLDRYLKHNGGIPDRGVALELRKLISGSRQRSKYRLVVIDHPDLPKDVGGNKRSTQIMQDRDPELVAAFHEHLATEKKG